MNEPREIYDEEGRLLGRCQMMVTRSGGGAPIHYILEGVEWEDQE